MRSALALCLIIAFSASAIAAPKKPQVQSRPVSAGPGQAPSYVTPRGIRVYRDDTAPGGWRTDRDEPPSPNDPSRRGSG